MTDTCPPLLLDQGAAEPAPLPPAPTDLPPGTQAADRIAAAPGTQTATTG